MFFTRNTILADKKLLFKMLKYYNWIIITQLQSV